MINYHVLHHKSHYSCGLATGTASEIIDAAKEKQIHAIAITDVNTMSGVVDFIKVGKDNDQKVILGCQLSVFSTDELKPIDILIVDGLAGMGGSGSETEMYSKHSKELKALANKWKILVILICHASKGGKKTDRDLSGLVRSSEKIIDNCDFYITTSLFKESKDEFNQQYGAMRLINKRGSGNTIDTVYDFNGKKLLMNDSLLEFNQFDSNNEF